MFGVAPGKFEEVAGKATYFLQHQASDVPGLIEIAVLGTEDKKEVLVLTQWESKSVWAKSRWNAVLGEALTDLVESSTAFDVRSFVPLSMLDRRQEQP